MQSKARGRDRLAGGGCPRCCGRARRGRPGPQLADPRLRRN